MGIIKVVQATRVDKVFHLESEIQIAYEAMLKIETAASLIQKRRSIKTHENEYKTRNAIMAPDVPIL